MTGGVAIAYGVGGITMARKRGIVKWFNRLKGFGFIEPEDGTDDIFVHYTALDGEGYSDLQEGASVGYDEIDNGRGLQARNVRQRRR